MIPSSNSGYCRETISSQRKQRGPVSFRQPTALTLVKKESQIIAKNPVQFLEKFASGNYVPMQADTSELQSVLGHLEHISRTRLNRRDEDFKEKQNLTKSRTFLMSMASNPTLRQMQAAASRSASKTSTARSSVSPGNTGQQDDNEHEGIRSHSSNPADMDYYEIISNTQNSVEVEEAIREFIEQIKSSDIDNTIVWVNTLVNLNDVKLPYGFPVNLRMPRSTSSISDPTLASFVESASDEFFLLDAEYFKKLEEVTEKLKENYEAIQTSRWSPKDSALLYYVMNAWDDSSSHHSFKTELLKRLFPLVTQEQITLHKYRLKMKKAWEEKRDNIIKQWIKDKEDLQSSTNTAWDAVQAKQAKAQALNKEKRSQKEVCAYWKNALNKLRLEKRMKIRNIQIMVEPYEKAREDKERSRLDEESAKRRYQKQLIEEYKDSRQKQREKEIQDRQRIEAELANNAKLQAKYNRLRVRVRQFELEKKQEAQRELNRLKEQERKLKDALLERSKYKVDLDYDPSNVLADTHASMIRRYEVQSLVGNKEEEAMIKFFRERYSFSAETLLKDRRVRLEGKLRDAGLIDCAYARQVLKAMEPKSKPHLHSHIEFKDD